MKDPKIDPLKPFKQHGVVFTGHNTTQAYGTCPFTGKAGKFYVNIKNMLWDSKTAGTSGNLRKFLELIHEQNVEDITDAHMERLAENRGLPLEAFEEFEFGLSSRGYTFPSRDADGVLVNLRMFPLGGRILGTATCPIILFNSQKLKEAPVTHTVYLCEGEWDTIAMNWLIGKLKLNAVAVGVPGANTFKREWAELFRNRDVVACYDHDEAGEQGELIAKDRLAGVANSLVYLHWPISLPSGYDLRDLIKSKAVAKKKPRGTYKAIKAMMRRNPRKAVNAGATPEVVEGELVPQLPSLVVKNKNMKYSDVEKVFNKWLHLKDTDALKVAFATIFSTVIPGDPLWMALVAPPGASKTEIINSFSKCNLAYLTSSLTPHALISGANFQNGQDPSMIPKLDGKCLCVKDLTVIMNKKEAEREEIFGILRDAYDGSCSKDFGNGLKREYKSHFSLLCGVTPVIYSLAATHAGLGERISKFYIGDPIMHPGNYDMCERAIENVGSEVVMREEMANAVAAYMDVLIDRYRKSKGKLPTMPPEVKSQLIHSVQYAANLRGNVMRDLRNNDIVISKPFVEVGTRLSKNMAKLLVCLAMISGREECNEDDLRLIRKVCLDTVDQRLEEIVRKIYLKSPTIDDSLPSREISRVTDYNQATVGRIMNNLALLKIANKVGRLNKFEWTITPRIREHIEKSGLYTLEAERERVRGDKEIFEQQQKNSKRRLVIHRKKK